MEILNKYGKEDLAILYIGKINGKIVEFVESVQPPISRDKKWVLIISTLYGCPMKCLMCDAGEYYHGKISKSGMLKQIEYMISKRFPNMKINIKKFKIQFARMGEPSLNNDVLNVLRELPLIYDAPGLIPCISTVAPDGTDVFFDELLEIKNQLYSKGNFQLQFSIHSTDCNKRAQMINSNIWDLQKIQKFGEKWYTQGDRKITLNFVVTENSFIDPLEIAKFFHPSKYFIKLTPLNPTEKAKDNDLKSAIHKNNVDNLPIYKEFQKLGYETLISIGEWEESQIGSNCGQFATQYNNGLVKLKNSYSTSKYALL